MSQKLVNSKALQCRQACVQSCACIFYLSATFASQVPTWFCLILVLLYQGLYSSFSIHVSQGIMCCRLPMQQHVSRWFGMRLHFSFCCSGSVLPLQPMYVPVQAVVGGGRLLTWRCAGVQHRPRPGQLPGTAQGQVTLHVNTRCTHLCCGNKGELTGERSCAAPLHTEMHGSSALPSWL